MALETATYINGLVSTNPVYTDGLAQTDDHIRLIKSTLKATFPNLTGAVTATQAQIASAVSLMARVIPVGGIILWNGLAAGGVPSGWQICDGTNGTYDLRNYVVTGADSDSGGTNPVGSTSTLFTGLVNSGHTFRALYYIQRMS